MTPAPPAPPAVPADGANGSANGFYVAGRRHGAPEGEQSAAPAAEASGGRRRRAEGETNDVLERLLGHN